MISLIQKICCLNDEELGDFLYKFLVKKGYGDNKFLSYTNNYIIAEGKLPICLVAHIDTVFSQPSADEDFLYDKNKHILWSPYGSGFDDRAGIAMILQIIEYEACRPSVIFTFEEEVGGVGAKGLIKDYPNCPFKECKAIIELDRAGEKDCVFYNCDNKEFQKYIESFGYETKMGTFTDISIIAPKWKIAAVNLSVGYIDEHTPSERLNFSWYNQNYRRLDNILIEANNMKFYKYITKSSYCTCYICNKVIDSSKTYSIGDIREEDFYKYYFPYRICEKCYKEYF